MMIPLNQDPEIHDALIELDQANTMFRNAVNKYRIDEAIYRMSAANSRIQAIISERMEATNAKKMVRASQAQET